MGVAGLKLSDLIGGILTAAIGALTIWEALSYPLGTLGRMGPGYFPILLGALLIGLGAAIPIEGRRRDIDQAGPPAVRPILPVLAGVGVFGLLVEWAGMVPAVFALVLICSLAEPRLKPVQTLIVAVVLSGLTVLIFVEGLGLALRPFAGM